MSRIGKLPVTIPSGVKVAVEPEEVRLEGPKGKLKTNIPAGVKVKVEGNIVRVEREVEDRKVRALHGLTRKLIANMAQGVSQGFSRVLEINGVGYRDHEFAGANFPVFRPPRRLRVDFFLPVEPRRSVGVSVGDSPDPFLPILAS